ncbi:MAG: AAA family ATPase [Pirellulaceae bacterium]|nr:AAA family ATPase [Pirellulaceae bacterium]
MYEKVFQLKNQPFSISPNVEHYFAAKSFHLALSQCKLAIERGSGPAVVVGGPGTGKTLLLLMLAEDYHQQFRIAHFACSKLDNRLDLLRSVMFSLKQPFRDMAEGELRLAFTEFLQNNEECPNGVLLLIDDAHWLNTGLLDELRILSGISVAGQTRCRVVITGNQCLEESLADPQNDSLNQRIATRNLLSPLSSQETESYIREHLRRAGGGQREFFTESAIQRIHGLSHGIPRMINQVCDAALVACSLSRHPMVDDILLLKAWQEIEQFPTNWAPTPEYFGTSQNSSSRSDSVIEFGTLSEFDSEPKYFPENQPVEQTHPPAASSRVVTSENVSDENRYHETEDSQLLDSAGFAEIAPTPSEETFIESVQEEVLSHPAIRLTVNPFAEHFETEEEVVARIKETCQSLNLSSGNLDKIDVEQALAEIRTPWSDAATTSSAKNTEPEWELGSTSIFLQFENPTLWGGQTDDSAFLPAFSDTSISALQTEFQETTSVGEVSPASHETFSDSAPSEQLQFEPSMMPEPIPEDDSDIVVITRPANIQVADAGKCENPSQSPEADETDDDFVIVENSKGRAIRMDYQELFQQLRHFETH